MIYIKQRISICPSKIFFKKILKYTMNAYEIWKTDKLSLAHFLKVAPVQSSIDLKSKVQVQ